MQESSFPTVAPEFDDDYSFIKTNEYTQQNKKFDFWGWYYKYYNFKK